MKKIRDEKDMWVRKINTLWIILMAIVLLSGFQDVNPTDEQSIKEFNITYEKTFNEHNAEKLVSLWDTNGVYTNLTTHEVLQGNREIAGYFNDELKDASDLNLKITIDEIKMDPSGLVIQKGTATTTSKDEPENKSVFLAELKRSDGSWKLQKVIEVEDQSSTSNYEKMKNLTWLAGQWNGEQEHTSLSLNGNWDENKNFLIQNFIVTALDKKIQEGKQIIGWDSAEKKVRSWMIDSDGGFGEGLWNSQGDQWFVRMTYTLSDGRRASATNIYKKIDENTFTFAAVGRDIDGKMLPDLKPITIKRVNK